jgi:hypothetical protein
MAKGTDISEHTSTKRGFVYVIKGSSFDISLFITGKTHITI